MTLPSYAKSERILVSACLIALALFLVFLCFFFYKKTSLLGHPENMRDTFSMSGHGEISAVPDIAIIRAGLETTAKNVADAQKQNTERMNGFLKKVKDYGVNEKDRKTTDYTITPKYEFQRDRQGLEKNIITGYSVSQQIELKIRSLDTISSILSLLGEFELNQVGSFSFSVDDKDELKQQALEHAVTNARVKAERLGRSGRIHIGRLISFSENTYPGTMMAEAGGSPSYDMKMAPQAPTPTIEKGSTLIESNIFATFEILP